MSQPSTDKVLDVAIAGAGFSGICMGIQLRQAGMSNFKIFEKTEGIGGTWYDNTYPGAACDIPSHLYCFSFELNPDWSHVYSGQQEIYAYAKHCVAKYQLSEHLNFGNPILSAHFDEPSYLWRLYTGKGEEILARAFISAVGALNEPFIPEFGGKEDFQGEMFHSARWNHQCVLANKKVAVIGSAASAVQIIPTIASEVEKLVIFQRTPNYMVPRLDRPYTQKERARYRKFPWLLRLKRWLIYWVTDMRHIAFTKNSWIGAWQAKHLMKQMRKQVSDPQLQQKLVPSYPLGCKRVLICSDYYPTLNRDNVKLVTDSIDRFTPEGILTKSQQLYPLDVVVFATGFRVPGQHAPFDIRGLAGQTLNEAWQQGAKAHYGITVANFPNFFILVGPNTGLGHNSIIFMIEAQVNYILQCLKKLRNHRSLRVKESAMEKYNTQIQQALENTVWAADCPSWYKNPDGKISTLWPYKTFRYWWATRKVDFTEYEIR